MQKFTGFYLSPIGTLEIQTTEEAVLSVRFVQDSGFKIWDSEFMIHDSESQIPNPESRIPNPEPLRQCLAQLDEYFSGARTEFTVPVATNGSPFEKLVWKSLLHIPFGKTASYAEVAANLGNKRAIRAVGSAAAKNPLLILVPCHRMIGSGGTMTGYAAGIARKEWLLHHESGKPAQPSLF